MKTKTKPQAKPQPQPEAAPHQDGQDVIYDLDNTLLRHACGSRIDYYFRASLAVRVHWSEYTFTVELVEPAEKWLHGILCIRANQGVHVARFLSDPVLSTHAE